MTRAVTRYLNRRISAKPPRMAGHRRVEAAIGSEVRTLYFQQRNFFGRDSAVAASDLSHLTKMVSITNLVNSLQVRASFAVLKWRAFLAPQIGEIARAAPMRDFVCSRILNSLR